MDGKDDGKHGGRCIGLVAWEDDVDLDGLRERSRGDGRSGAGEEKSGPAKRHFGGGDTGAVDAVTVEYCSTSVPKRMTDTNE